MLSLAQLVAGPIIKPLLGKAVVPDNSPYTTGGVGLLGTAPSVDALQECDTLITCGSGFPYMEFYPKPGKAKTVQIDVDPTRIGLRHPADVGLINGIFESLRTHLLARIPGARDRSAALGDRYGYPDLDRRSGGLRRLAVGLDRRYSA